MPRFKRRKPAKVSEPLSPRQERGLDIVLHTPGMIEAKMTVYRQAELARLPVDVSLPFGLARPSASHKPRDWDDWRVSPAALLVLHNGVFVGIVQERDAQKFGYRDGQTVNGVVKQQSRRTLELWPPSSYQPPLGVKLTRDAVARATIEEFYAAGIERADDATLVQERTPSGKYKGLPRYRCEFRGAVVGYSSPAQNDDIRARLKELPTQVRVEVAFRVYDNGGWSAATIP